MKLTSDSETLAENKALILYILDKVSKPITNTALLELVLSIENMNYFYFQHFLLDLIENKYIINYEKNEQSFYELTPLGKETLELVKDLIPGILKFKVDNNLKGILKEEKNKSSIIADFTPNDDNGYTVSLKIIDNNTSVFDLKLYAGSREQAQALMDKWNKNAEGIYSEILNILNK